MIRLVHIVLQDMFFKHPSKDFPPAWDVAVQKERSHQFGQPRGT